MVVVVAMSPFISSCHRPDRAPGDNNEHARMTTAMARVETALASADATRLGRDQIRRQPVTGNDPETDRQ